MLPMKWSNKCRGVSHTPSMAGKKHIKRWGVGLVVDSVSAHMRAYAIRPYTCSVEIGVWLVENTIINRPAQSWCFHRFNRKYVWRTGIRPSRQGRSMFDEGRAAGVKWQSKRRRGFIYSEITIKSCMIKQPSLSLHHETNNLNLWWLLWKVHEHLKGEGTRENPVWSSFAQDSR